MQKLEDIVEKLSRGIPLSAAQRDHQLTGNFVDFRECHIEQNWLLIYRIHDYELVLELIRTGTHNDLFGR